MYDPEVPRFKRFPKVIVGRSQQCIKINVEESRDTSILLVVCHEYCIVYLYLDDVYCSPELTKLYCSLNCRLLKENTSRRSVKLSNRSQKLFREASSLYLTTGQQYSTVKALTRTSKLK